MIKCFLFNITTFFFLFSFFLSFCLSYTVSWYVWMKGDMEDTKS